MPKLMFLFFGLTALVFSLSHCAHTNPEKTKTRQAVMDSLAQQKSRFKECGDNIEEKSGKAPTGRVVLGWDIDETGFAQNTSVVENTTKNNELAECLRNSLNFIDFPTNKLVKTYKVQFPFVFKNKKDM